MESPARYPLLQRRYVLLKCIVLFLALIRPVQSCPLCEALSSTLRDDLQAASAALIGKVVACSPTEVQGVYLIRLDEEIAWLKRADVSPREIRLQSLTEIPRGTQILVLGFDATCERGEAAQPSDSQRESLQGRGGIVKEWIWVPPVVITAETANYLLSMPSPDTPEDERLLFFFEHLGSSELLVSDDAYNECARAPLKAIQSRFFLEHVDLAQVITKLRDVETPDKYKSFYWMLLAEKGSVEHRALFEELAGPWLKVGQTDSDQTETRLIEYPPWIPAAIATFARLGGESAIQEVEATIFKNPQVDMPLVFSAVSAFRALGNELEPLDRSRFARSFEILLEQPRVADLIIADLARWEHWTVISKLRKLFLDVDPETTFVRTPIITFMRSCPLPEAAEELDRMREEDPKAYRRSVTLLPTIDHTAAPK
jgi:hypothetical protein